MIKGMNEELGLRVGEKQKGFRGTRGEMERKKLKVSIN